YLATLINRHLLFLFIASNTPPHPRSTLFPYTTLFRSSDRKRSIAWSSVSGRSSAMKRSMRERSPSGSSGASSRTSPVLRAASDRSEEHTSELQSRVDLVCRLLLEKKKKRINTHSCYGK